jgi:hypothetical protein
VILDHRLGGDAQQHGMGFAVAVCNAQGAGPVEQQAGIACVLEPVHQGLGLGQAGGLQRNAGIADIGAGGIDTADLTLGGSELAAPQKIVQPGAVAFRRKHSRHPLQDGLFGVGVETAFAQPLRISAPPRAFSPEATNASPNRILPMLELGVWRRTRPAWCRPACRGDGGFGARLQRAAQRPGSGAGAGFGIFDRRIDLGKGAPLSLSSA